MSIRSENFEKLNIIYNTLYDIDNCSILNIDNKNILQQHIWWVYDNNLEEKHLEVLEPYYNYRIKQRMLDVNTELKTIIFQDSLLGIPFISIDEVYIPFIIPKNWKNITINTKATQSAMNLLHIRYSRNIDLSTTTDGHFDDMYTTIHKIVYGKIKISEKVYLKLLKKSYLILVEKHIKRNWSLNNFINNDIHIFDKFITEYVHAYMKFNKNNRKEMQELNNQLLALNKSRNLQLRIKCLRKLLELKHVI